MFEGSQFRWGTCGRPAAAVEEDHSGQVPAIHATSILAGGAGRLADHLSRSEVTPEVTHRPAASAFHSEQTKQSALYLECRRVLHDRDAANGGGIDLRLRI